MFQLYHMEKELKEHGGEVDTKQKLLEEVKAKQKESEKELKEKNKEQAKHHKEALILESKIRAQSQEEGKANEIKTKEEVQFVTQKIKSSEASLTKINEEYKAQSKTIESLKSSIEDVQEELKQFKALEAKQKKEKQITLVEDQIAEYNAKKEQVFRKTAERQQQLTQYSRLQKTDQEAHDNLSARLKELESRKVQLTETIKKLDERKSKIGEIVDENTNKLAGLKQKLTELSHQSRADK
jgi:exonuclease SbcC